MKKEKTTMPLTHTDDWRDYLSLDSLVTRSGVKKKNLIKLVVKELVDNALDASERCDLGIICDNGFYVQDYGTGIDLSDEGIAYLFSVGRKTYTSKGIRYPQRGAFGRGLRVVTGAVFCYEANLYVSTLGRKIALKPEGEKTTYEVVGDYSGPGTRIEITFPDQISEKDLEWGHLARKMSQGSKYTHFSSPWWYDSQSFLSLLQGLSYEGKRIHLALNTIFGKFSVNKNNKEVQQFLRRTTAESISPKDATRILDELRKVRPKKIVPQKLGCVGRLEGFDYYQVKCSSYFDEVTTREKVEVPFVLELWAQPEKNKSATNSDGEIVVFVNKSPWAKDKLPIFRSKKNSWFILNTANSGYCKIDKLETATSFYLNIITPYLPRTGDAKLPIIPEALQKCIENIFNELIKKIKRNHSRIECARTNKYVPCDTKKQLILKIARKNRESINNLFSKENLEVSDKKYLKLMAHDPFMTGLSYTAIDKGLWFKDMWDEFNPEGNIIHLRRFHYRLVSCGKKINKHNGDEYKNNHPSWQYLLETSKFARELELIDSAQIIDQRNPEPFGVFDPHFQLPKKMVFSPFQIPEIDLNSFQIQELNMPSLEIDGSCANLYTSSLQPVHLEIWTEKATMNDILEGICEFYGIMLIQNTGYASITGIETFLRQRALVQNRPSIIFYISDFDEAGENMPVSVARTLQHRIFKMGNDGLFPEGKEIVVEPIILKKEQMESEEFKNLPNAPAKIGVGTVTELDALEAVLPGKFREIVEENIKKVLDVDVIDKMHSFFDTTKDEYSKLLHSKTFELEQQIEEIRKKLSEVTERHKLQLQELSEKLQNDYEPYKRRIKEIEKEISRYANDALQKVCVKVPIGKNHQLADPLYNSSRQFKVQTSRLDRYRSLKKR